jgi:hypothetical protein
MILPKKSPSNRLRDVEDVRRWLRVVSTRHTQLLDDFYSVYWPETETTPLARHPSGRLMLRPLMSKGWKRTWVNYLAAEARVWHDQDHFPPFSSFANARTKSSALPDL